MHGRYEEETKLVKFNAHHCCHYCCFNWLNISLVTAALIKRPIVKDNQEDNYTRILTVNGVNWVEYVLTKLGIYQMIFLVSAEH